MPPIKSSKAKVKEFIQLRKGLPPVDMKILQKFCRAPVSYFKKYGDYELTPGGPLIYQDNGSDILGVAHLDSVEKARHFSTTKLSHDMWINCPTVDDRMGVFTVLHQLPQMDITPDVLLTTGEEWSQSTAMYFTPPKGKVYNWIFSFDRGGEDVVLYQYYDWEMKTILERHGWKVGFGSYSCIAELEHMRVKGFNFGVGMIDYHSLNARVSMNQYLRSLKKFTRFYAENYNKHYPHLPKYNIWTPEDGFALVHKPGSVPYQDTFTEEEIELIEQIDYEGLDLGSRITPMDIKEAVHHRETIAKNPPIKDPSLFDESEDERIATAVVEVTKPLKESESSKEQTPGIKVAANVPLSVGETRSVVPSEDDPTGSLAQTRKSGEEYRVIHSDSGDFEKAITLAEQEESQGKETKGPVIYHLDQEESKVEDPKPRLVNLIPLGRISDEDEKFEYVQDEAGNWIWREIKRAKFKKDDALVF